MFRELKEEFFVSQRNIFEKIFNQLNTAKSEYFFFNYMMRSKCEKRIIKILGYGYGMVEKNFEQKI